MSYFEYQKNIKKLEKIYKNGEFFKSYIKKSSLFPLELPLKKLRQKDIQNSFEIVQKELKELKKYPFELIFEEFNFKLIGKQKLPIKILVKDEEQFFKIVQNKDEFERFKKEFEFIISIYPKLDKFFSQKPFLVLEFFGKWQKILKVVDYFLKNDKNIYIREICIDEIDTKFIENHKKILDLLISFLLDIESLKTLSEYSFEKKYNLKYPLSLVRFRSFDKFCMAEDITLTTKEFNSINLNCTKVFIVENLITFLTFPFIKKSIVIFGSGYGVSKLKEIEWLKTKDIFYWGDIDLDGFAILSQLRNYFPQTKSFLMDIKTLKLYEKFGVIYKVTKTSNKLLNLSDDEQKVYDILLTQNGFRIEQEQLPFDYIRDYIYDL